MTTIIDGSVQPVRVYVKDFAPASDQLADWVILIHEVAKSEIPVYLIEPCLASREL